MGRVKNFFKSFTKKKKVENSTKTMSLSEFTSSRVATSEGSALNLSGVYTCVDIISNTISKLPFFLMDNSTKKHIDDSNLYKLLNYQPNPRMTASVFKKLLATSLLITGNAYAIPKWRGLKIYSLEPVSSENVQIIVDGDQVYYRVFKDGKESILRYDEIIHLKMYTVDGVYGISPLTYARLVVQVGLNQENFQKSFYENGGRPSGVLKIESDLSGTTEVQLSDGSTTERSLKDVIRDEWAKTNGGSVNAFKVAVLDNGMDFKEISQISPADMDFVNSKTVNLEDIARFFNVPPYKLGVGKQTYSNNEQAQIDYITNCIVPLVYQIEQELTLKLILARDFLEKNIVVKMNLEGELRGDTSARANWYEKMQSMGVYSINDILSKEDMPKIENGDARLIGPNAVPLEQVLKNGGTSNSQGEQK